MATLRGVRPTEATFPPIERAEWVPSQLSTRILILVAGLFLSQCLLFWPSLLGQKILLPLDLLALPGFYLPDEPEYASVKPGQQVFEDLILEYEMSRRFTTAQLHEGRIPLWDPNGYTGAPFVNFFKYSPFMWLYYAVGKPWTLAWIQLLVALTAGVGAYLFLRRVLRLQYWPSVFGAWCYPLTGFFMLWQGFSLTYVTAWFPWLLLATDRAVRVPSRTSGPALALLTCLVLVSGQVDVAGQALLASGLYGAWCWIEAHRVRTPSTEPEPDRARLHDIAKKRMRWRTAAVVLIAWTLGILLAAPYLLPLQEYVKTGARFAERVSGEEERPPIGLSALPQIVLPDIYGTARDESMYLAPGNQLEGPPAAYSGLLLTLLLAPLAWRSRTHRSVRFVLGGLALLALSWDLNLPGFVQLLRLPILNIMSHNRFVFVASLSFVALAAIGLQTLLQGRSLSIRWLVSMLIAPAVLAVWCMYRASHLPEPLGTVIEEALRNGQVVDPIRDLDSLRQLRAQFANEYRQGAAWCVLAVLSACVLATRLAGRRSVGLALAGIACVELLWTAQGFHPQEDPKLYYPSIPVLEELAKGNTDRVLGVGCLPPNLNERFGLRDIRGYDAVDPAALVDLLESTRDPNTPGPKYSKTRVLLPLGRVTESGTLAVSPVISMLNVRYLIFRGAPSEQARPHSTGGGYWIAENPECLPRPFIPRRVEQASNESALQKLADPTFDPREVAYVDAAMEVPDGARGQARIIQETPHRIAIAAEMETPGVIVLSDLWDRGWRARVNGNRVSIARANHAVRAVAVPAGSSTVVFEYRPVSLVVGIWLFVIAGILVLLWGIGSPGLFRLNRVGGG